MFCFLLYLFKNKIGNKLNFHFEVSQVNTKGSPLENVLRWHSTAFCGDALVASETCGYQVSGPRGGEWIQEPAGGGGGGGDELRGDEKAKAEEAQLSLWRQRL